MNVRIELFRNRFGMKSVLAFVALCAALMGAWRFSRDHGPAYLYSGWLVEGDESRRAHAAQELGAVNEEPSVAIGSLAGALISDRAVAVRKQSARSLGRVASKRQDETSTTGAARALVRALADEDATVRAAAAEALGQIAPEPEQCAPALLRATADADQWVRGAAIAALGLIQRRAWVDDPDARRAIAAAMNDESVHVRELGIYAFWLTAEISPEFSRGLLRAEDVRTRRAAALALARSGPLASRVVPDLRLSLNDPDAIVRAEAARALENCGQTGEPASSAPDTP